MTEYSRWFNIRGKLSNREYSEIKNTVMFSTFTVVYSQPRHTWAISFPKQMISE
jgi:hypothetical protein